jgi:hypothetical protein
VILEGGSFIALFLGLPVYIENQIGEEEEEEEGKIQPLPRLH